jgi:hypothetical protein
VIDRACRAPRKYVEGPDDVDLLLSATSHLTSFAMYRSPCAEQSGRVRSGTEIINRISPYIHTRQSRAAEMLIMQHTTHRNHALHSPHLYARYDVVRQLCGVGFNNVQWRS